MLRVLIGSAASLYTNSPKQRQAPCQTREAPCRVCRQWGPPQREGGLLALEGEAQLRDGLLGGFRTGLCLPQRTSAALARPCRRPLLCLRLCSYMKHGSSAGLLETSRHLGSRCTPQHPSKKPAGGQCCALSFGWVA